MRFTFNVEEESNLGRAAKRDEKRARKESEKALRMERTNARRAKAASRNFA